MKTFLFALALTLVTQLPALGSTQYWLLEYLVGGTTYSSQFATYDSCNAAARAVDTLGGLVTKWCLDSWDFR